MIVQRVFEQSLEKADLMKYVVQLVVAVLKTTLQIGVSESGVSSLCFCESKIEV